MKKFNSFVSNLSQTNSFFIKYKNESFLMKLLNIILFFNKGFMTDFTTTIGNTIYFPSKELIEQDPDLAISIVSHELIHIKQSKSYGGLGYSILYLFPQILSLLSILFVVWFPFIFCLIFLLPIPAYFRMKFEFEGYLATLLMLKLILTERGFSKEEIKNKLEEKGNVLNKYFKDSGYYYMWPFGVDFTKEIQSIMSGHNPHQDSSLEMAWKGLVKVNYAKIKTTG
jgi:hypothetical protein